MNYSNEILHDAVSCLMSLPRQRELQATALARFAKLRAAHPDIRIDIVIDKPPGHPYLDFDVLLRSGPEGVVAIGWRPDDGMPWAVRYSEHWAANLALTVNDYDLTVQDALLLLSLNEEDSASMTGLVDQTLIAAALRNGAPQVSQREIQIAADKFRMKRGLLTAAATGAWLTEIGLSVERFEAMLKTGIQARKLEQQFTEDQVKAYFSAHENDLGRVTLFYLESDSAQDLSYFVKRRGNLLDLVLNYVSRKPKACIRGVTCCLFKVELLPAPVPDRAGARLGPLQRGSKYWYAQTIAMRAARFDQETRIFIRQQLFREWLDDQRSKAKIKWHWM